MALSNVIIIMLLKPTLPYFPNLMFHQSFVTLLSTLPPISIIECHLIQTQIPHPLSFCFVILLATHFYVYLGANVIPIHVHKTSTRWTLALHHVCFLAIAPSIMVIGVLTHKLNNYTSFVMYASMNIHFHLLKLPLL